MFGDCIAYCTTGKLLYSFRVTQLEYLLAQYHLSFRDKDCTSGFSGSYDFLMAYQGTVFCPRRKFAFNLSQFLQPAKIINKEHANWKSHIAFSSF